MDISLSPVRFCVIIKLFCFLLAQTPILGDPCGYGKKLLINNSDTGEILSPTYPSNYPNNADCQWHINLSPGYVALLTFLDFETQQG